MDLDPEPSVPDPGPIPDPGLIPDSGSIFPVKSHPANTLGITELDPNNDQKNDQKLEHKNMKNVKNVDVKAVTSDEDILKKLTSFAVCLIAGAR